MPLWRPFALFCCDILDASALSERHPNIYTDEQGDSTPAVEHSHMLVAISLEGETLHSRSFWQREQELCHLRGTTQLGPMPFLRQEPEVRSRQGLVQGAGNAGVQIWVLCSEDDPHGAIKRLEVWHPSRIGLHVRRQIAGQTDERGEGAWHAKKLRPDDRQESFPCLLIIAELTSLPVEKPLGNGWVLGYGPGECGIGRISEEADELGKAQGGCLSIVR